jgi:hypothetical protein
MDCTQVATSEQGYLHAGSANLRWLDGLAVIVNMPTVLKHTLEGSQSRWNAASENQQS